MALPASFLEQLRAATPMPALVGRRVKLAKSGRQWKGCCPFHNERTPSFYVYDDHYHCFGCGPHGDAIAYVMQQQAMEFREAVDQLAAEAGLEVPKSPEANAIERRRLDLAAVLQAAEESYARRLFGPEGKQALAYLRGRGLTDETIKRFGLGWSGDARGALGADLARQGITTAQLIEARLLRQDQQSDRVTDQFYRRIMFPIRDRRGRPVSFGGRILGSGEPKYVNGPETSLFAKRRTLYGLDLAREGVAKGERLVVVEGYMDVIALHQAGFSGAVAPLGTSLTDEHLDEIWRHAPSPILCFDGDAAGGKAAARAIEMALPMLAPDRTLRIVTLPNGDDPDSLVQRHGFAMFDHALHTAAPLSTALYHVIREQVGDATPEQRAMLRRRLEDAAKGIPDKGLATEYRRALLDRFFDRPMAGRPAPRVQPPQAPPPTGATEDRLRVLAAILLHHPELWDELGAAFESIDLPPWMARVRDRIRAWTETSATFDPGALLMNLIAAGLQAEVARIIDGDLPPLAQQDAPTDEALSEWWQTAKLLTIDRLREDAQRAEADAIQAKTPETMRRLVALRRELQNATAEGSAD